MNYKVYFDNNKATHCEVVKEINDISEYATIDNIRVIKSLVIFAYSEKEAMTIGERFAERLNSPKI
jgi:hypothetical protein